MKKTIGIILAFALALSLSIPALAQETFPLPKAEAPTDVIAYNEDGDDYYTGYDVGYEEGWNEGWNEGNAQALKDKVTGVFQPKYQYDVFSLEPYNMETYEDGYNNGLKYGYWRGYYDTFYLEVYEAAYQKGYAIGYQDYVSGNYGANQPEVPPYDGGGFSDYDLKVAWGLYDGYWTGESDAAMAEAMQVWQGERDQEIKDLGGTPGQINVRLNNACVPFPDAFPEIQNDRTMVPVRAVMESLGAEVTFTDGKTVTIVCCDTVLTLTIGSKAVTVEKGGAKEEVLLDAAPYIKNDRTYVPLRFVSEALGFRVFWDDDYRSVVIFDGAKAAAEINQRLSTLNTFLKTQATTLKGNWITNSSFSANLEVLDSIKGNKTYTVKGSFKAHSGETGYVIEGSLDLSQMVKAIQDQLGEDAAYYLPEDYTEILSPQVTFAMKLNPQGEAYLKSGLLDRLFKSYTGQTGETLDLTKPTWYKLPGLLDVTLLDAEGYNLGNLLCQSAFTGAEYYGAFYCYDSLMTMVDQIDSYMGNATFKQQGDSFVWNLNEEKLLDIMFAGAQDDWYRASLDESIKTLDLTFTFTKNGNFTLSGKILIDDGYTGTINIEGKETGSPTDTSGSLLLQLKNAFNFLLKGESHSVKTHEAPNTAIPAGEQVVDLEELTYW